MGLLTAKEKEKIRQAVRRVEKKTQGELVTVIAGRCDSYRFTMIYGMLAGGFLLPGLLLIFWQGFLAQMDLSLLLLGQLSLAFFGAMLAQIPFIKMALVPQAVKEARARALARRVYYEQGLHLTRDRSGVLIFVAAAERYVEILADAGIHRRVPEGTWDNLVANFIKKVKSDRIADGFVQTIGGVGVALVRHFPARKKNINELRDGLVEL